MDETQSTASVPETEIKSALGDVMSSFVGRMYAKADQELEIVEDRPEIVAAREAVRTLDLSAFSSIHLAPFERLTEALVASEWGRDRHQIGFIIMRQDFLTGHLSGLFKQFEGWAYSSDKKGTILRALLRFYATGKRIEFDYEAEYTYQLPTTVLKDHDSIVAYFEGLIALYGGRPKKYLESMQSIAAVAASKQVGT